MTEQQQDEVHQPPTYAELLWEKRRYLYVPLCLFSGLAVIINVGLLVHLHVVELGLYAELELVEDRWVYYTNTVAYSGLFSCVCWLLLNDRNEDEAVNP